MHGSLTHFFKSFPLFHTLLPVLCPIPISLSPSRSLLIHPLSLHASISLFLHHTAVAATFPLHRILLKQFFFSNNVKRLIHVMHTQFMYRISTVSLHTAEPKNHDQKVTQKWTSEWVKNQNMSLYVTKGNAGRTWFDSCMVCKYF